ncbi:MAG: hypothetical protein RLZ12_804 [Bacillota bacterium]|jgi:arginine/lysine/ornithine decarboxylase
MQTRAPLFEMLLAHASSLQGSFYVPGHKHGALFDEAAAPWFRKLLDLDATEVGELDDLHDPQGVIAAAQKLAAEAFGAKGTFFLVGGTTLGNLAAVLALCTAGDELVMQRSSHQSLFHAAMLSRAVVHFLPLTLDKRTGLELPIDVVDLERILSRKPVKAVVLTSPSYFGLVQPLKAVAALCHSYQVPLIVDEAHGAHFAFNEDLPAAALAEGADIAIQSTHKTLTSLTMSSMLHFQGNLVNPERIQGWLRMLASSSPSYLLMASLDVTRRLFVLHGEQLLKQSLALINKYRSTLNQFCNMLLLETDEPFRWVLAIRGAQGVLVGQLLTKKKIFPELVLPDKVLFLFSAATNEQELQALVRALTLIDRQLSKQGPFVQEQMLTAYPGSTISYATWSCNQPYELVPLVRAVGRRVVRPIIIYPPGIPLLCAEEKVSALLKEKIEYAIKNGLSIRGLNQPDLALPCSRP